MSLSVIINGDAIDEGIPPASIAAQSIAKDGGVGFGGFTIEDPGALLTTTGHKLVTIEETACSQPRLFTGYVTERQIARSVENALLADEDRQHDVQIVDLNAGASFRIITATGGKRPEETMSARITWLLGYQAFSAFAADTGFVTYRTDRTMDAADYIGRYPKDVLDDLAQRIPGYTWFIFWDTTALEPGLYFGPDSVGIAESALSISNDIADVNPSTGVYPPDSEAKLKRSPEETYSEVILEYAQGTKRVYRKRASTATAYVARGTTTQRPFTSSLSTANAQAEAFLDKHSVETDTIIITLLVLPEDSGLVTAGQRIDVKFTHLDDYTDWTSMRVISVNVRPANDVANRYFLDLELELPVPAPTPPTGVCEDDLFTAADTVENQYRPTVGYPTITHTPAQGVSVVVMAGGIASNWNVPNDSDWVSTDTIYTAEVLGSYHPLYAVMARYVAVTSGSETITASYTPGYEGSAANGSYWAMLAVSFETDTGTAVQTKYATASEAGATVTATLDAPPTNGNVIFMFGVIRDQAGKPDPVPYPNDGKWTFVGKADAGPIGIQNKFDRIACWRRCVNAGDTSTYGMTTSNSRKAVHLSEWAATATITDETDDLGDVPGTVIVSTSVTPATNGTVTTFYTFSAYRAGSLLVYVDGVAIPAAAVTETDPATGEFDLAWAPDADEIVTVTYMVG